MSNRLHGALERARAALEENRDLSGAEEIDEIIRMFTPHAGDDPAIAKAREVKEVTCENCQMTWPAMATSAPILDSAITLQRFAKCPRCFSTRNIFISQ